MGAHRVAFAGVVVVGSLLGGCHSKKPVPKEAPPPVTKPTPPPPPPETEADREAKRASAAHAIIPEGATCLPAAFKDHAPRLELAAVEGAAEVCAIDDDRDRLLGPIGCFKIDLASSALSYVAPHPIPGVGFPIKLDGRCARGYCIAGTGALPSAGHIAWSTDGKSVAVLAGDEVRTFAADTKSLTGEFTIRGDKAAVGEPHGLYFVGDAVFVLAGDAKGPNVFVFKTDGTPVGPIEELGGKPGTAIALKGGALSVLDKTRVGLNEQGLTTLTTYEVDSGKRSKAVRKVGKAPCKPEDQEAYWKDPASVADAKCKGELDKQVGAFVGASGIAGSKNLLFVLHGARTGELGVVDPKTLGEQKKIIKLAFCDK